MYATEVFCRPRLPPVARTPINLFIQLSLSAMISSDIADGVSLLNVVRMLAVRGTGRARTGTEC